VIVRIEVVRQRPFRSRSVAGLVSACGVEAILGRLTIHAVSRYEVENLVSSAPMTMHTASTPDVKSVSISEQYFWYTNVYYILMK
jgi:hypothetical protein